MQPDRENAEFTLCQPEETFLKNPLSLSPIPRSLIPFLIFLLTLSIHSLELTLTNDEIYVCDFVQDNGDTVKVRWKQNLYEIPRSSVAGMNMDIGGPHTSYRRSSVRMKDGSVIRGILVEDKKTDIVIKTDLGYMTLSKDRMESPGDLNFRKPELETAPEKGSVTRADSRIGIFGSGYASSHPLVGGVGGGGFILEPAFAKWKENIRFGLMGEYDSSTNARYSFGSGIVYFQYRLAFSERKDFYLNLGGGASYVQYHRTGTSIEGLNPAGYIALGWQGLKWRDLIFRVGVKALGTADHSSAVNGGGEFAVLYRL